MSSKTNAIAPNTVVGARNISKNLENLTLSPEALVYLERIGGILRIEISPETNGVNHSIVDRKGEFLISTREFEKLANYKSHISKEKKRLDILSSKDSLAASYHHSMNQYRDDYGQDTLPARVLESNNSKFGLYKKFLENIDKNLKLITSLPTDDVKQYLISQGETLHKVYVKAMSECMGPIKYEQSTHDERLLGCCIPKYLESKFIDPAFARDAKTSANRLIFPKGNFSKSISFTIEEIQSDAMMRRNILAIRNSHSIIQLAQSTVFRDWLIKPTDEHSAELITQYNKMAWPMLMPGTLEDFLTPRVNRVSTKTFSMTQAPRGRPGTKDNRPENILQLKVRNLKNTLGKVLSVMMDFFHLIPRVDRPIDDFWSLVLDTTQWIISPEKRIYDWIQEGVQDHAASLNSMRNNSTELLRKHLASIVCLHLDIPETSTRYKELTDIFSGLDNNNAGPNYLDNPPVAFHTDILPNIDLNELNNSNNLNQAAREAVATFRNKQTEELISSTRVRRNLMLRNRLPKSLVKELNMISDDKLRQSIRDWVEESFSMKKIQKLAIDFAIANIEKENLGINDLGDDPEDEYESEEE